MLLLLSVGVRFGVGVGVGVAVTVVGVAVGVAVRCCQRFFFFWNTTRPRHASVSLGGISVSRTQRVPMSVIS